MSSVPSSSSGSAAQPRLAAADMSPEFAKHLVGGAQLFKLGNVAGAINEWEDAKQKLNGSKACESMLMTSLGIAYHRSGDLTRAKETLERSLVVFTELHNTTGIARAHMSLGNVFSAIGDAESARPHFDAGLKIASAAKDTQTECDILHFYGEFLFAIKDNAGALQKHQREKVLAATLTHKTSLGRALAYLGRCQLVLDDYKGAKESFDAQLKVATELQNHERQASAHFNLSCVHDSNGEDRNALVSRLECLKLLRNFQPNCLICSEEFAKDKRPYTLMLCLHAFHETCLTEALEKQQICPECKMHV